MAVPTNDCIQTASLGHQVGIDIRVHFDAGRILSEADMRQCNDHVVGRAELFREFLGLCNGVTESQARDIAR